VDANKVDRLSADEKIAGFLLAWATLFTGVLLEQWLAPSTALVLSVVLLGALAGYFYWRAREAQREMKERGEQVSLEDLLSQILGGTEESR
jgi:membrane protein implicated in regulation of membrane protease activity